MSQTQVAMLPLTLPPGVPGASVLLVANEPAAGVLRQQLSAGGYVVVDGPTEGIIRQVLYQHPPSVALIAGLPPEESWRCCALIKADATAFVPVILIGASVPGEIGDDPLSPDVTWDSWPPTADLQRSLHTLVRLKVQIDHRYAQLDLATERFERIKATILHRIAHELSTPMLQVKTAVALLADDIHRHGLESSSEVATMATKVVARLENLILNIRQLSHSHHITFDLVNFEESADYAIRQLKRNWELQNAVDRISKEFAGDLPPVLTDKFALAHLLQILLDNALRYSPPDAPVIVRASVTDADTVRVDVEDFGAGIPADQVALIATPFYKVSNDTHPHQRGAGLGLALASLLASSLHTELEVKSAPGKGSLFSFRLPIANLQRPPEPLS